MILAPSMMRRDLPGYTEEMFFRTISLADVAFRDMPKPRPAFRFYCLAGGEPLILGEFGSPQVGASIPCLTGKYSSMHTGDFLLQIISGTYRKLPPLLFVLSCGGFK